MTQHRKPAARPATSTNDLLARVSDDLRTLVLWAEADAECSRESDAPDQATNDKTRARWLRQALELISHCTR